MVSTISSPIAATALRNSSAVIGSMGAAMGADRTIIRPSWQRGLATGPGNGGWQRGLATGAGKTGRVSLYSRHGAFPAWAFCALFAGPRQPRPTNLTNYATPHPAGRRLHGDRR